MNYLAYEQVIIDRLKSTIDGVTEIVSVSTLTDATLETLILPAIHVFYDSETLIDKAARNRTIRTQQKWGVAIAIQNLSIDKRDTRVELGDLITQVVSSLQGFKCDDKRYSELVRVDGAPPINLEGGYVYFPIYFTTTFITTLL